MWSLVTTFSMPGHRALASASRGSTFRHILQAIKKISRAAYLFPTSFALSPHSLPQLSGPLIYMPSSYEQSVNWAQHSFKRFSRCCRRHCLGSFSRAGMSTCSPYCFGQAGSITRHQIDALAVRCLARDRHLHVHGSRAGPAKGMSHMIRTRLAPN